VDFTQNVIHVRRSEWEGHVTLPPGRPRGAALVGAKREKLTGLMV
jgi:hypothetical protein